MSARIAFVLTVSSHPVDLPSSRASALSLFKCVINEARELFNYGTVENGDTRFIRGEYVDANEKVTEVEDNNGEEQ